MADRAIEQDASLAPDAQGEARVHAALVEPPRGLPDAVASGRLDADLARRHLRLPADAGDGVEIGRNPGAR
jgi:hypothetical protein